jgi:DNA polymerase-3 subunit alpha
MAKMVPFGFSLNDTLEKIDEFKQLYQYDDKARKLIDLAKKLEGVARHASTHACGVVISKDPLEEVVPLQFPTQNESTVVTQYEMHAIEDLGILKMDFLGLKNLTIIEETLAKIYKVQGQSIDIQKIPMDDKETYQTLKKAETVGVFQLESGGMRRYLKQLKPSEFEDIIAMVALYRPGPMEFIPDYIDRKNGKKKIHYIHPKLEPILKNTQGICIYQEQLMQIARQLAGFTLGEADVLRKAVGKKIESLLIAQKEKFIEGMIKNKIEKATAEELWEWVLPFAKYGFNRSHSASYATIAYQTAWLKTHYPVEYMSSILTSEKNDVERISVVIEECEKMNIKVLPPDINESFMNFGVVPKKNQIRFGLLAIKNVGQNVVESILQERKERGHYTSIEDFVSRVDSKALNKKSMESLIKSGAFDKLGERNQLIANLENLLVHARETQKNKSNGQKGLFDGIKLASTFSMAKAIPSQESERLKWEKELLGLYVSGHPVDKYKDIMKRNCLPIIDVSQDLVGKIVKVGGVISGIKRIITKKGQPMLFVGLEDGTSRIEVVVFPSTAENYPYSFVENKVVFIKGKVDNRDNVPKIICSTIEEIMEA